MKLSIRTSSRRGIGYGLSQYPFVSQRETHIIRNSASHHIKTSKFLLILQKLARISKNFYDDSYLCGQNMIKFYDRIAA